MEKEIIRPVFALPPGGPVNLHSAIGRSRSMQTACDIYSRENIRAKKIKLVEKKFYLHAPHIETVKHKLLAKIMDKDNLKIEDFDIKAYPLANTWEISFTGYYRYLRRR